MKIKQQRSTRSIKERLKMKRTWVMLFSLLMTSVVMAQNIRVTGLVQANDGEPLIGVTVKEQAGKSGTITDIDGRFALEVSKADAILTFTYVGYEEVKYPLNGKTDINITMSEDTKMLDEIVVIGYGATKKSDLTGSVASIKSESLERFPASNVTEMLRGQAAGLNVKLDNSAPGGASKVQIRGSRSLSSSQNPLYILDGMIVPHINDLNSSDIASIEVLKDASSQAIYGSRASNGVILVTTKRGKEGKLSVDFSSYIGFQTYHRNFDLYSPKEFADLRFWAKYNEGTSGIGTPDNINYEAVIDDAIMYNAFQNKNYVDWEDLMLTNAVQQKYDISLRGGDAKIRYAASFGYLDQEGIVTGSGYRRGNFRSNIDFSPLKWFDFGVNMSFSRSKIDSQDTSFSSILTMPQIAQAYDADGNLMREASTSGTINPLWKVKEYSKEQLDDYLNLATNVTIKPFRNFSYKFSANIRTNNREVGYYKTKLYPASTGEGQISEFNRSSYLVENVLNYDIPFRNKDHKLQATLIHAIEQDLQKTTGMNFINSTTDIFKWNVVGDSEITNPIRSINRTRSVSFASRIQYGYSDRYLLTASLRRDGASVFGDGNKWANFPSVALAWRLNNEAFMSDFTWLNQLKARVSYGVVGNWAIPAYRTLGLANAGEYLFGDELSVGYLPSTQLLNKDLKWETTESMNYGIDFGIFKDRLTGSIEYYNTRTKDLLVQRAVPTITSYSTMWDNLGETKSSGLEITLNGSVIREKDLEWNVGVSFSRQKNEIVKIDGRTDENGKPINDLTNRWFIGKSINVTYQYVFAGIWQEGEVPEPHQYLEGDATPRPGDIKLGDTNGDGKITVDDRKIFNTDPDWYGSINTAVKYKNFDLQLDFYTVQGVKKHNSYMYGYNEGGSLNGKLNGIKVDYWTENNPSNSAPRPQFTAAVPYMGVLGLQDASYFRLRSATLGYTLPKKWTSKLYMSNVRLYATATNVFTITDYKSYSPEKDPGGYPEPKTYTFGVNVSF